MVHHILGFVHQDLEFVHQVLEFVNEINFYFFIKNLVYYCILTMADMDIPEKVETLINVDIETLNIANIPNLGFSRT